MSSSPDRNSVWKLRELAIKHRQLETELDELNEQIVFAQARKKKADDEHQKTQDAIIKQLEAMDCASPGNGGWQNRMAWMLAELATQVNEEQTQT
jgi:hypothetical protein